MEIIYRISPKVNLFFDDFFLLLSSHILNPVEKYWVLIFYKNCGKINCNKFLFAEAPEKNGF